MEEGVDEVIDFLLEEIAATGTGGKPASFLIPPPSIGPEPP